MIKITAIVPTFNEEDTIVRCLKSLAWADEIIVVDSFSSDETISKCQGLATRIIQHEYENSAAQKNWVIPQASHEWIFLLDADEYVETEMYLEVKAVLKTQTNEAYWIRRRNFFMGKRIRFSGWQGDKVIRLFKRDSCRYEVKNVHSEIITDGNVGWLKSPIYHSTYKSLDHYLSKIHRYTTWGAMDRYPTSSKITYFHFFIKPAFRFIQFYFFRLGFLDGKRGFIIASFAAYSVYLRSVKIWEMQLERKMDKR